MQSEANKLFGESNLFDLAQKTLWAALVLLLFYVIGRRLRRLVLKIVSRSSRNVNFSALLSNVVYIGLIIAALVIILTIYTGAGASSLLTLLGILSLAVSLSVQDVLKNFVAGVYILLEQPFKIGDRISVKNIEGVIESIEIRTTNLRTDDGIQIIIPNNTVFSEIVANRSAYNRRMVTVRLILPATFDFQAAITQITSVLSAMPEKEVLKNPAPAIILENTFRGRTTLRVEFWTQPEALPFIAGQVAQAFRQQISEADVKLAVPKPLAI